ncbi:splicing factor 3B subunit 2-like [Rhinophrynus dorsalis]
MAEIQEGNREDLMDHTTAQVRDDAEISSTAARLAQMAGMPLPTLQAPPPPPGIGRGFPIGLASRRSPTWPCSTRTASLIDPSHCLEIPPTTTRLKTKNKELGKEFETRLKEKKPGDLSDELRITLGMPVGPNSHKVPPPWLIAMQRYGPPPSYPNLKIPGLNSPIPEGCSFGYHAGGWGKPPVDEMGKPLYGDVFGTNASDFQNKNEEEDIDRTPWGELELSDDETSSEEEDEESDEDKPDETGFITPADSGLITPGGFSSVPAGMETPELIELRKKKIEEAMDGTETPQLFTVLPEKRTATVGGAMMGSTHIYDITTAISRRGAPTEPQGVEIALAPEELEMDPSAMTQKYEERVREAQEQVQKEDFSDMVAEHAAKQKQKKRKGQPQDSRAGGKKYKEFKF